MPRLALACFLILLVHLPALAGVQLGIDRLQQSGYAAVAGKRLGLITNQTGVNSAGQTTRSILRKAPGVKLVALFTPEHGLDGTELAGRYVATRKDAVTGLTAYSLYGPTRKPTPQMLAGLDALVFDLQDIGVRSYTYISTMARCMEAAGEAGLEFIVLDRPNPLGGRRIEGPPIEANLISFVGQLPVPYVHGMTAGELAKMLNDKGWMAAKCKLTVVPMQGWTRNMVWNDTGLRWVRTSPNIPRASSCAYYVATGIVGSLGGLETGVGGPTPFEVCATGSLDAEATARTINGLALGGISATPYVVGGFRGVRLQIDPAGSGDLCALALHLLALSNRASRPDLFARSPKDKLDIFFKVYGSHSIQEQLQRGVPASKIIAGWTAGNARFAEERKGYLLY